MEKKVKKALAKAKKLEKHPLPTEKEIKAIYKDLEKQSDKLKKLLEPSWFMGKMRSSPTRKKKSL